MTEYRQAGHCFLLSHGFGDTLSTNMDDWYDVSIPYLFFTPCLQFNNWKAISILGDQG